MSHPSLSRWVLLSTAALLVPGILRTTACSDDDSGSDPCQGVTCSGHGTCDVRDNGPVCRCESGYQALGLSCIQGQASCGDGLVNGDEVCDGTDLSDATCQSEGFGEGPLACADDCLSFDTTGCWTCGDGLVNGDEVCDGTDLSNATCRSQGFRGGTLACANDCLSFDTTGCWKCGDGICSHDQGEMAEDCPDDCKIASVALGAGHTCVLTNSGDVFCWGADDWGQITGVADTENPDDLVWEPQRIQGIPKAESISAGDRHTCIVSRTDGSVWCWGADDEGQLGDGGTNQPPEARPPIQVPGIPSNIVQVSAGRAHACARTSDGAVWCWGSNKHKQCGQNGPDMVGPNHIDDSTFRSAKNVSAGGRHTCVVGSTGGLWCWGKRLGATGQAGSDLSVPTSVSGISGTVFTVQAGQEGSCAGVGDPGNIKTSCWGNVDTNGCPHQDQVWTVDQLTIRHDESVTVLTLGALFACAITGDKTLSCWGDNSSWSLGIGTTLNVACTPQALSWGDDSQIYSLSDNAPGAHHACLLTTNGDLWCWGANGAGQVDGGDRHNRPRPVSIPF